MPRRDDVRRVGQPRPRRLDPDHPRGARRRDQLHRHRRRLLAGRVGGDRRQGPRRAGATTSCSRRSSTARWARTRTARQLAPLDHPGGRGRACGGWAPTGSTSTRCTAPSPTPTSTRRSARSTTSSARARSATSAARRSRRRDRRGAVGAERRGRERFVSEQPPYSMLVRGDRGRRAADCAALRDGRDPVEPARRRLAVGRYRKGAEPPEQRARRAMMPQRYDLSLPENQRKLEAADRLAQLAEEARPDARPAGDRVRARGTRR